MVNMMQLTHEGFKELFESYLPKYPVMKAYEMAESMHETLYGRRRYSCYQNFLKVKRGKLENLQIKSA